jgi:hypothetical protein
MLYFQTYLRFPLTFELIGQYEQKFSLWLNNIFYFIMLYLSEDEHLKSCDQDAVIKTVTTIKKEDMGFNNDQKVCNVLKTAL